MQWVQLEPDGQLLPLDNSAALTPAIGRTWFLVLAKYGYSYIRRQQSPKDLQESEGTDFDDTDSASDVIANDPVPRSQGRVAATMAGGRRRKAARRRG